MRHHRILTPLSAIVLSATSLAAQPGAACPRGPGAALGVTSYQCSSCGARTTADGRMTWTFHAEPVVLVTSGTSALAAGDVIVAVDGHPITTSAGAGRFASPAPGPHDVLVRRGRDRLPIRATAARCEEPPDGARADARPSRDRAATSTPRIGRYGFAVSCAAECVHATAADGTNFWRFVGHPPIDTVRPGSPAAAAGLHAGDLLIAVDGHSILDDEGALHLLRAELHDSMILTIRRGGRESAHLLRVP